MRALGLRLSVQNASSDGDIDAAFSNFAHQRINAVMVAADAYFRSRRDQLAALITQFPRPMRSASTQ
jgi:hypothetical protein